MSPAKPALVPFLAGMLALLPSIAIAQSPTTPAVPGLESWPPQGDAPALSAWQQRGLATDRYLAAIAQSPFGCGKESDDRSPSPNVLDFLQPDLGKMETWSGFDAFPPDTPFQPGHDFASPNGWKPLDPPVAAWPLDDQPYGDADPWERKCSFDKSAIVLDTCWPRSDFRWNKEAIPSATKMAKNPWSDFRWQGVDGLALDDCWSDDVYSSLTVVTVDFPVTLILTPPSSVPTLESSGGVVVPKLCNQCLWAHFSQESTPPPAPPSDLDSLDRLAHQLVTELIGKSGHLPVFEQPSRPIADPDVNGVRMQVGTTCDAVNGSAQKLCRFEVTLMVNVAWKGGATVGRLTIMVTDYREAKRQGNEPPRLTEVAWTPPTDKEGRASEDWIGTQLERIFDSTLQQAAANLQLDQSIPAP